MPVNHEVLNAMSIDVEDYYQVSAFAKSVDYSQWSDREQRVERNTYELLDIFDRYRVKSTFFILGWVAERYKKLVQDIAAAGHEVACHGYSHQLIYKQTPEVFRDETVRAKKILEDVTQQPVDGYRAASFSIASQSLWALDILYEAGFKYDSSIFPVRHDRYGIPDSPVTPHKLTTPNGNKLVEFPMTTRNVFGWKMPVSGGGYFRLYPYWLTRNSLRAVNKAHSRAFMFYLHPWEIDPEQPKIEAGLFSRFRHYNNLKKCANRLERLLTDFQFSTVKNILQQQQLLA